MTLSSWLSFSTDLVYLAAVLSLLAVIAFKLSPIRAVRYWWVRRERDRIAARQRYDEMQAAAMNGLDLHEEMRQRRLRLDAIVRMK